MEKRNPWTQPDEPSAWRKLLRAMRRREGRTSMCRNSMLAFQLVPLLPIYHLVSRQTSGRAKWTHQAKQAEVEIKVERRPDVLYLILNLSLNLSLLPAGGLFQQPAKSLSDIGRSTAANDPRPSASFSAQKNPQRIPAWSQTFNATDMSTMYPYAYHNTIPAAFINCARGSQPRPGTRDWALSHCTAVGSRAKHRRARSPSQ